MAGKVGRNCYRLEAEEQTNQTKVLLDLRTPWDSKSLCRRESKSSRHLKKQKCRKLREFSYFAWQFTVFLSHLQRAVHAGTEAGDLTCPGNTLRIDRYSDTFSILVPGSLHVHICDLLPSSSPSWPLCGHCHVWVRPLYRFGFSLGAGLAVLHRAR